MKNDHNQTSKTFMKSHKGLAILFLFLTYGAFQETYRILTSSAPDISNNRSLLIPIAFSITAVFLILAIRFWIKTGGKSS
jgi:hypothetical protein